MEKSIRLIYNYGEIVDISMPNNISVSFIYNENSSKMRIIRVIDENMENKDLFKEIFNKISLENLETVEYLLNNNPVGYITSYTFQKVYYITDNIYGKITTFPIVYGVIDLSKGVD